MGRLAWWTIAVAALLSLLSLLSGVWTSAWKNPRCGTETSRTDPYVSSEGAPAWEIFESRADLLGIVCPGKRHKPDKMAIKVVIQFGLVGAGGSKGLQVPPPERDGRKSEGFQYEVSAGIKGEKTKHGEGELLISEKKEGLPHPHFIASEISEKGICDSGEVCTVEPGKEYHWRIVAIGKQNNIEYPGEEEIFTTCAANMVTYEPKPGGGMKPVSCYGKIPRKHD